MEKLFRKFDRWLNGPEISIFHEFHKPPYGGGNQFLLALEKELKKKNCEVGHNKAGRQTKTVLFNSFNFDFDKLSSVRKKFHPSMIHRVDGPISAYRGEDREIDQNIWEMNHELADQTIFQSQYSLDKHIELGLNFKDPVVIYNASDPELFHSRGRVQPPDGSRKIKLIATAWSDNPRKGGPLLSWLDEHLDHTRYELTFVGRTRATFKGAKVIPPVPSEELANILRENDIYIAPSEDDPCSNALVEALTCGLPAVFRRSGGHPELAKDGGEGFNTNEEALAAIDKVAADYLSYQNKISNPTLAQTVDEYLKAFKLK